LRLGARGSLLYRRKKNNGGELGIYREMLIKQRENFDCVRLVILTGEKEGGGGVKRSRSVVRVGLSWGVWKRVGRARRVPSRRQAHGRAVEIPEDRMGEEIQRRETHTLYSGSKSRDLIKCHRHRGRLDRWCQTRKGVKAGLRGGQRSLTALPPRARWGVRGAKTS